MFGEYTANWIATVYVIGVLVSYVVNAVIVRNDRMPLRRFFMRHVVLWPIYLPLLIVRWIVSFFSDDETTRRERYLRRYGSP